MNYIKLIYLRWKFNWLAAQWEHAAQLSETYRGEAENIYVEMQKIKRHIFMRQPVKEVTQ